MTDNNYNITHLGFHPAGYNFQRQDETAANSAPKQSETHKKERKQYSGGEILGSLDNPANRVNLGQADKIKKVVNVQKYVPSDSSKRIGESMKNFETFFNNLSETALDDFSYFPQFSEQNADKLALKVINRYLDTNF